MWALHLYGWSRRNLFTYNQSWSPKFSQSYINTNISCWNRLSAHRFVTFTLPLTKLNTAIQTAKLGRPEYYLTLASPSLRDACEKFSAFNIIFSATALESSSFLHLSINLWFSSFTWTLSLGSLWLSILAVHIHCVADCSHSARYDCPPPTPQYA